MALESYARNLYGASAQGDISLVTIVITASGRDASRSSPDTTVGAGSSGAYVCTLPGGQGTFLLNAECVNSGADTLTITSLSTTAGVTTFTVTKSDTTNATGAEELHIAFLVGRN